MKRAMFLDLSSHLISPEWLLSDFPRTSSRIPGTPLTLQNGIKTAAFLGTGFRVSGVHDEAFET